MVLEEGNPRRTILSTEALAPYRGPDKTTANPRFPSVTWGYSYLPPAGGTDYKGRALTGAGWVCTQRPISRYPVRVPQAHATVAGCVAPLQGACAYLHIPGVALLRR